MISKPVRRRPYRRGVGALLFDARGRIFVAQRRDTPGPAWQMPQGGIDPGETTRVAIKRELLEEIGTNKARIVAESPWLTYDLPARLAAKVWGGRYRGQKQKWFAMRFTGIAADIDLEAEDPPEFTTWRWVSIDELVGLAVPFKRVVYRAVIAEFRDVVRQAAEDFERIR